MSERDSNPRVTTLPELRRALDDWNIPTWGQPDTQALYYLSTTWSRDAWPAGSGSRRLASDNRDLGTLRLRPTIQQQQNTYILAPINMIDKGTLFIGFYDICLIIEQIVIKQEHRFPP